MFTYRGRRDRELEGAHRREVKLSAETICQKLIKASSDELSQYWRSIPVNIALANYDTLRNARHDLWVEYFTLNSAIHGVKYGDVKLSTYITGLTFHGVDIDIGKLSKWKNWTPDILVFDPRTTILHIGDIAVSVSRQTTDRRKYEKYFGIADELRNQGMRVQHSNFIVQEDLMNVRNDLNMMANAGLVKINNDHIVKVTHYQELATKLMSDCRRRCDNTKVFEESLKQKDKDTRVGDMDLGVQTGRVDPYIPIRTEDEIMMMVKKETDRIKDTYYDNGYEDAKIRFNELYKSFEQREHMHPKSTLKATYNSRDVEPLSGYELLLSYIRDIPFGNDETVCNYVSNILPTTEQVHLMKECNQSNFKENRFKNGKVHGPWQYTRITGHPSNFPTLDMNEKLQRKKSNPNEKKAPKSVSPDEYPRCMSNMTSMINMLGSPSAKNPFLDDSWDSMNMCESENTMNEKETYDYVRKTCGVQIAHSFSGLYQRLTHVRSALSTKENIYIPPNGAFVAFIPRNHMPFNKANSNCPIITICRKEKGSKAEVFDYEYCFTTINHVYYVSKLARLELNKMAHWDQAGHKIVACATYIASLNPIMREKIVEVVGTLTVLALDLHQKTSEILDLLKYVSFMPFSNLSRLSRLIMDKFDIMLKTDLDVWILKSVEDFMDRLSKPGNVSGIKERTKMFNGVVLESCLGMKIKIPSFIHKSKSHERIQDFIEEINALNMMRGKHFYGSQFMDKSIHKVAEWNHEHEMETDKYGGWTSGHDESEFPFDAKFCFSSDAIYYSQKYREKVAYVDPAKIVRELQGIKYDTYVHELCSLRGCTKEKNVRKNQSDLHTTSMDAAMDYYSNIGYNENLAKIPRLAFDTAESAYTPQYTMSEKEQRGGGRPIATPTLKTKIMNAAVEKPEQAIGSLTDNNILVAGKHKTSTQSKTYKELLEKGYAYGKKEVYQVTEDQSKFSENDNTKKFEIYIRSNELLPENIRHIQLSCIKKNQEREHLVKHMPTSVQSNPHLAKYLVSEGNGVKAIIGWPQGMYNNISTSIHSNADIWITYAFNKMYKKNIQVKGLVHSDDSWYAIACDNMDELKLFTIFRVVAKKLFCLKTNDKKLWISKLIGELISNFSINGEVLVSTMKTLANSFGGLLYQNWPMDVSSQISSIQQLYRQGANIGTLITVATILRQQIMGAYHVDGVVREWFYQLPIEMGGYPKLSVLELGVCGTSAHYRSIMENVLKDPKNVLGTGIKKLMTMSMVYARKKEETDVMRLVEPRTELRYLMQQGDVENESYSSVILPERGEIFCAVKHIMPKSIKITKTVNKIKALPFETDGLEMIITRPKTLKDSLGHLKSRTSTMIYELAAEKYSGNKRRLAMNQALQASGKTVRLAGMIPMTLGEMVATVLALGDIPEPDPEQLEAAFSDNTDISVLCAMTVNQSDMTITNNDKRHAVNRMPQFESKFDTICPLRNVLLYIIDGKYGTNYREIHGMDKDVPEIIDADSKLILKRFSTYFSYYNTKVASNLIMQQYLSKLTPRLWMQPRLRNDTMENFITDLYGKTLNAKINYKVTIDYKEPTKNKHDQNVINSIYTVTLLNEMYDKFKIQTICGYTVSDILKNVDYSSLNQYDFLKYGVLCNKYMGVDIYLRKYDESKEYTQDWIIPQQMVNGVYKGDFDVICKYGNCVARIIGRPENVKIYLNKPIVNDLLMLMYLFVTRNFNEYRYSNPMQWSMSKFWQSMSVGEYELRNFGHNINIFRAFSSTGVGMPVDIITSLGHRAQGTREISSTYVVENNLRVVYKISEDYRGDVSKIKVDSVKQNMVCPYADKIVLEAELIDGFLNQDLLSTKLILNISMRRIYGISTVLIKTLLAKRIPTGNNVPIMRMFLSFMRDTRERFKGINIPVEQDDVIEVEMEGGFINDFVDRHLDTEPEVLDAVEMEYIYDESTALGATVKHSNIYRFLAKCVSVHLTDEDIASLFKAILSTSSFKDVYKELVNMHDEDGVDTLLEYASDTEFTPHAVYAIMANKLDVSYNYGALTVDKIRNAKPPTVSISNIADEIVNCLSEITFGEARDDLADFFD